MKRLIFLAVIIFAGLLPATPAAAFICTGGGPPVPDAVYIDWANVPDTMTVGQTASVSLTFKNDLYNYNDPPNCPLPWYANSGFSLKPTKHSWSVTEVPVTKTVLAYEENTFIFFITAPSTPGKYGFEWQMYSAGYNPKGFIGQISEFKEILVVALPGCSDGKDNDNDGKRDYPADPGCSSASDDDESDPPPPPPVVPSLNFDVNPKSVPYNNPAVITWEAKDVPSCTASANPANPNWTGPKALSGTKGTGNLIATTVFTITCGALTDSETVTVAPPSPPTVSLTAPASLDFNTSGRLSWESADAVSCTASSIPANSNWTGPKPLEGLGSTGNLTTVTTFTITCYDSFNREATDSKTVTINNPPPPPPKPANDASCVSISAPSSVVAGRTFNASVTMLNTGSGNWSKTNDPAHIHALSDADNSIPPYPPSIWQVWRVQLPSEPVGPGDSVTFANFSAVAPSTPGPYSFNMKMLQEQVEWFGETCTTQITVVPAVVAPFVDLSANPVSVPYGGKSTLSWTTSSSVTRCNAAGGPWSGSKSVPTGSEQTVALNANTRFTITCYDALNNPVSDNVVIVVSAATFSIDLKINSGKGYLDSDSGSVPLSDVDLKSTTGGTANGPITYKFYCDSRQTTPTITQIISTRNQPDIREHLNLCDYETEGRYFAKVEATRARITDEDSAEIVVAKSCQLVYADSASKYATIVPINDIVTRIWQTILAIR